MILQFHLTYILYHNIPCYSKASIKKDKINLMNPWLIKQIISLTIGVTGKSIYRGFRRSKTGKKLIKKYWHGERDDKDNKPKAKE